MINKYTPKSKKVKERLMAYDTSCKDKSCKVYGYTKENMIIITRIEQEDKKECESCQHFGKGECDYVKCYKNSWCEWEIIKNPKFPSLLNDIETIEEIREDGLSEYVSHLSFASSINLLIKNQRILTEIIKSLLIK